MPLPTCLRRTTNLPKSFINEAVLILLIVCAVLPGAVSYDIGGSIAYSLFIIAPSFGFAGMMIGTLLGAATPIGRWIYQLCGSPTYN